MDGQLGRVHGEECQDVVRGFVEAGQDVDGLGREVAALTGALVGAGAPPGVEHSLTRVLLVQQDQVATGKVKERRTLACDRTN